MKTMNLMKLKLLVFAVVMLAASSAFASLSYDVTIDTSSLLTTNPDGYLYFQFTQGSDLVQAATASIQNFTTGGTLGAQDTTYIVNGSAVTGTLPGTVTMYNTNAVNDYNQAIHFGNSLSFTLVLDGPGVTSPNNLATTVFSLSLFGNIDGTNPLLTTDGVVYSAATTPIPAAAWLLGSGLMGLAGMRRRKC
jgi:hypothetical protein